MKKQYDDDDGRTIADMSQVTRPSLFGHVGERKDEGEKKENEIKLSRGERFAAVMGAMKAGLLIALVYVIVFGIVIWLMVKFL